MPSANEQIADHLANRRVRPLIESSSASQARSAYAAYASTPIGRMIDGVDADAAQQVRRRHDVEAGRLELGDDAVPARGVDEGAVDQYHGGGDVRRTHDDLL